MQQYQIVFPGRKITDISFLKMLTSDNDWLVKMKYTEGGKEKVLLFYMTRFGTRRVVDMELDNVPQFVMDNGTNPYMPYKVWKWANEVWKVTRGSVTDSKLLSYKEDPLPSDALIPVRQEQLTVTETGQALNLAELILRDPLFGFSDEVIRKVKNKTWKRRPKTNGPKTKEAKPKPKAKPVIEEVEVDLSEINIPLPAAEIPANFTGNSFLAMDTIRKRLSAIA